MMGNTRSRSWRVFDALLFLAALGVGVWTVRHPLYDIVHVALRDQEQSHILLVPFVAAWLIWLRRSRLRFIRVTPSLLGPLTAVVGWGVNWFGFEYGVQIAEHAGAFIVLLGVLISFCGLEPLRQFKSTALLLVFALPVPGTIRLAIAHPLQTLATDWTYALLELFSVAVEKSGNVLIINGEEIAVAEACNGMRMVFALTLVVYAFAFSVPLRLYMRVTLIVLSPFIALACNVIRLIPTSLFYGYSTAEYAEWVHDISGWIMLPIALFIVFHVVRMVRWLEFPVSPMRLANQ